MAGKKKVTRSKTWSHLQPGDLIDIVAPASESTAKEVHQALRFVHKFGLKPRFPKSTYGKDILCSNSDDNRFKHLKKALMARDSKAVWCMRGGYGSLRLMNHMQKMRAPAQCKLFIGYSDITAIHNFINNRWGWPTIHGTMLEELGRGEGGRGELLDFYSLVFGYTDQLEFTRLDPMNKAARAKKTIVGKITGGNLAILDATLGTPWAFKAKGKIVILEDIGERGYRVDRMLVHLQQAGAFNGIKALIFGDFVGGEENRDEDNIYLWQDVQKRFAKESSFPVLRGLPFGHGPFQRPVPFNTRARLQLGRSGSIQVNVR